MSWPTMRRLLWLPRKHQSTLYAGDKPATWGEALHIICGIMVDALPGALWFDAASRNTPVSYSLPPYIRIGCLEAKTRPGACWEVPSGLLSTQYAGKPNQTKTCL